MQDLNGLLRVHLQQVLRQIPHQLSQRISQPPAFELPSVCFTEIDQAFLIWGTATLIIFLLAQFSTLSWRSQAIIDAALTGASIALTSGLTWKLASSEDLRWVIFLWAGLMTTGMLTTIYGIFCTVGFILSNLCLLWLGLCGVGYCAMAVGMRSRCFSAACIVHVLAMVGLHYHQSFQFINSGLVMAVTLFFFSVVPWDMQASDNDIPC